MRVSRYSAALQDRSVGVPQRVPARLQRAIAACVGADHWILGPAAALDKFIDDCGLRRLEELFKVGYMHRSLSHIAANHLVAERRFALGLHQVLKFSIAPRLRQAA